MIKRTSNLIQYLYNILQYRYQYEYIKVFNTPDNYLKGIFCVEYSETLSKYGNNVESNRLLNKASELLKSTDNLSEDELYYIYLLQKEKR